ncbi:MAG: hydrogenase 3 maturation endopeptidase HyCI [Chloroflexota bacterium]
MLPSWKELLQQKLNLPRADNGSALARTCLVGVGSDLRGDDSAGLMVARALQDYVERAPHLLVIEGGPAPENHTGKIRAFQPELVIFIDAAHIDEPPGTIQWIPLEVIDGMSASSHSLPLSMVASYLKLEIGCEVTVLGIQPGQNDISEKLSPAVRVAVEEIVEEVQRTQ